MAITTQEIVLRLVVGMFDAAPGKTYLGILTQAVAKSGVEQVAIDLGNTAFFKSLFPAGANNAVIAETFAASLIPNFNPEEPAHAWAVGYVQQKLDAGIPVGKVIVQVLIDLYRVPETHPTWGATRTLWEQRVDIAERFSVDRGLSGTSVAELQDALLPPRLTGAEINGATLVLKFTDLNRLDDSVSPSLDSFVVRVAGGGRSVSGLTMDSVAGTVTLTLGTPVRAGQTVQVSYTDPFGGDAGTTGAGAIQDKGGNGVASFHVEPANLTPQPSPPAPPTDTSGPVYIPGSATVDGLHLVMSYSDARGLDEDHLPEPGAFVVMVGGVVRDVSNVIVDGAAKTVTLVLQTAVENGDSVTVSYTDPSGANDVEAIQDVGGNDAATVFDSVTNNTPDVTAPLLDSSSAFANNFKVVLDYIELNLLDGDSIPGVADYTVTADGAPREVSGVEVDPVAKTVTLTLSSPVAAGQTVVVTYADISVGGATDGSVQDASGNHALDFSTPVTNRSVPAGIVRVPDILQEGAGLQLTIASAAGDAFGQSGRSAGDVNGDGFGDVIVGAPLADVNGADAGASYVLFGKSSGLGSTVNSSSIDANDGFRINGGAAGDFAGISVGSAGDFNGDGLGDLIIGARGSDASGSGSGAAYLVYGKEGGFGQGIDLANLAPADGFAMNGVAGDLVGHSVSAAGDLNGDGLGDVIVAAGAANRAYVVFGTMGQVGPAFDLQALDGDNGFQISGVSGLTGLSRSGFPVGSAGDVNGDGLNDLVIGSPGAGRADVIFGTTAGFASVLALSALNGTNGFHIQGVLSETAFSVSAAGDVNGDGVGDLIIGSPPNSQSGAGSSYVVFGDPSFGTSTLDLSTMSSNEGFRLDGMPGDGAGWSVSAAGDFNGDGFGDLLIGAPFAELRGGDSQGYFAGSSYVVFGKASGFGTSFDLSSLDGANGLRIDGMATGDQFGCSVGAAGDVNGDGFADLIIGAPLSDANGVDSGASTVIYGGILTSAATYVGRGGDDTLDGGTGSAESFIGGAGNDVMEGGGGNDVFHAGAGNDSIFVSDPTFQLVDGGAGTDILFFEGAGLDLSLADMRGKIKGIEVIDISGSGANTLTLGAADIMNLSDALNSLTVVGDPDDSVRLVGNWIDNGIMEDSHIYQLGDVYLAVRGIGQVSVIPDSAGPSGPGTIDVSALEANLGFHMDGAAAGDAFGSTVSAAGDVNGDGFADVIVGAPNSGANGTLSGSSFIVFGSATGLSTNSAIGSNSFRIDGANDAEFSSFSVSSAGDFDGDGLGDLIIGAPLSSTNGQFQGASYIVFGKAIGAAGEVLDLSSLTADDGILLKGVTSQDVGFSVSAAGDINADGFDDVVVSTSSTGTSYVVFGTASAVGSALELSSLNGTNGFRMNGIDDPAEAGFPVSAAGDVNGDGIDDLIVGAPESGASFVVFGKTTRFGSSLDLTNLAGFNGFRIQGPTGEGAGISVDAAGDVNGDGIGDLIIGAKSASPHGASSGSSYVVFGKSTGFAATLDLSNMAAQDGFRLDGVAAGDGTGNSVGAAGDVNGDGLGDLIIGAEGAGVPGGATGASYLLFGSRLPFGSAIELSSLDGTNGWRIDGSAAGDAFGHAVGAAGDFNGDGFGDLIVGAPGADGSGPGTGAISVIYGGDASRKVTFAGTSGNDTLVGTGAAEVFVGGLSADLIIGGGGGDVIHAGAGIDQITLGGTDLPFSQDAFVLVDGGAGWDVLSFLTSEPGVNLTLSDVRGRVQGIESISLVTTGFDTLEVNARDVLAWSGQTNTLTIDGYLNVFGGPAQDTVVAVGAWIYQGNDGNYGIYKDGGATLRILRSIDVEIRPETPIVQLSSLDGEIGFRLAGGHQLDNFGASVAPAGDVNGDGFADLIVGAPFADAAPGDDSGAAYVIFGKASGFDSPIDVSQLNGANGGFPLYGANGRSFGHSVDAAGDLNGDGFGDVIVSESFGSAYVVFGAESFVEFRYPEPSALDGRDGFRLTGLSYGITVAAAGDVNGDGLDDVVIGSRTAAFGAGVSYVLYGNPTPFPVADKSAAINLADMDAATGFRILGEAGGDYAGNSVSAAGDLNGDGFGDLIIGASSVDTNAQNAGTSYVVFGGPSGATTINLGSLDARAGFHMAGSIGNERSGASVHAAGDVNGDGMDDLIIGGNADADGLGLGAYVLYGSSDFGTLFFVNGVELSSLDGTNGVRIEGNVGEALFTPWSVSAAGDVNADGIDDLIVGSRGAGANAYGAGASYVVYGQAFGFGSAIVLSALGASQGFRIDGEFGQDGSGYSVRGAGDVNGDGMDDVIVGAPYANANGSNSGAAYVIFGDAFIDMSTFTSSHISDTLVGTSAMERFIGGAGDDTMTGGGGPDLFRGGAGNDMIAPSDLNFFLADGGGGTDTLVLGMSGDLTGIFDKAEDIEVIDLDGDGQTQSLFITPEDVRRVSEPGNQLIVTGHHEDSVHPRGFTPVGQQVVGDQMYNAFVHEGVVLLVGVDVAAIPSN